MNYKSFQVFSSFNSSELKELCKFIKFDNEKQFSELIALIEVYSSVQDNDRELSKELIFDHIYPGVCYSASKLRLLQSDLQKLMEKFIVWKSLDEESIQYKRELLSYYKARSLVRVFEKSLKNYQKTISNKHNLGLEILEEKLLLSEKSYDYAIENRREATSETQELLTILDHNYLVRKLKFSCLAASQENVYNINFDHGLRDAALHHIDSNGLETNAGIAAYYYCYLMLSSQGNDEDFNLFSQHLQKESHRFSLIENTQLYTLAINFCIRALNQGKKWYGRKGIELYKSSLDLGILLANGRISKFTFRNIITMAVRIGEFDLAEEFIEKYQTLLDPLDKKEMVAFTNSLVLFSREKYQEASRILLQVHFKDLLFNLATKALQMKIYYELNEHLVLESHLDAMQIFLKRHQSLGYHKANYLNMISYTRKLLKANSITKIEKLDDAVKSEKYLTERRWFQKKISDLRTSL